MFKNILGEVVLGTILTRKELVARMYSECPPNSSEMTLDSIRRMLTVAGYLESEGLGIYRVVKNVDITLTKSELRNQAYGYTRSARASCKYPFS